MTEESLLEHSLGASGGRILMCIGVAQGIAMALERGG